MKKLKEAEQYQQGEDKRIEEERAVLREMEAREQREREKERRKKEDQKKRQESIIETNRRMAENKKQALLELEREEENYADKCRREAEALLQEEQEKQARRDRLKKQNSTLLTEQIKEQQKAEGEALLQKAQEARLVESIVDGVVLVTELELARMPGAPVENVRDPLTDSDDEFLSPAESQSRSMTGRLCRHLSAIPLNKGGLNN